MKPIAAFLAVLALAGLSFSARAAEKVELRAAEHDGYGRIAIEWSTPIPYEAKLDGDTLVIHFARPFSAELNVINRYLRHYVANVAQSADGMTITAKLLQPVELKTEIVGHNIIAIDLVHAIETPATKPDSDMFTGRKSVKAPAKTAKAKQMQLAVLGSSPQAAPLTAVPPAGVDPAPNPAAGQAVVATIEPAENKPAAPQAAAAASEDKSASGTLAPQLVIGGDQTSLRFDWPAPTAAAIYRRSSALWIVFAAATKLDLDDLRAHSQGVVSAIDAVPAGTGTALRLVVPDGLNPSIRRA